MRTSREKATHVFAERPDWDAVYHVDKTFATAGYLREFILVFDYEAAFRQRFQAVATTVSCDIEPFGNYGKPRVSLSEQQRLEHHQVVGNAVGQLVISELVPNVFGHDGFPAVRFRQPQFNVGGSNIYRTTRGGAIALDKLDCSRLSYCASTNCSIEPCTAGRRKIDLI